MRRDDALGKSSTGRRSATERARSLVRKLKIATLDRTDTREREAATLATPTVKARQEELAQFYRHYENLVDVLCDAAQYGPTPTLEGTYARERDWTRVNYAPVRRFVVAFLRYSSDDALQSLKLNGGSADAFEALAAAPNLVEFLKVDDGGMISRINRTREALNLYGEHLRQLGAKDQS